MMKGLLPIASLEAHIEAWKQSGMPDYANGKTLTLEQEQFLIRQIKSEPEKVETGIKYRPPFCKPDG
jgi:hypothetical protein